MPGNSVEFGGIGWSGLARVSEPLTHTRISLSLANLVKLRLTALRGTNFRAWVSLWAAKIPKKIARSAKSRLFAVFVEIFFILVLSFTESRRASDLPTKPGQAVQRKRVH